MSSTMEHLQWGVEWLLIGAIAAMVVYIALLVFRLRQPRAVVVYERQRPPPRVFLTAAELQRYNGTDVALPVYVAIRGVIYDVSKRRDMYGVPGQGYNVLTGREAGRALALMQLDEETVSNASLDGLTAGQLECLGQWEDKFRASYEVAGELVASAADKAAKEAAEVLRYGTETVALEQAKASVKKVQ